VLGGGGTAVTKLELAAAMVVLDVCARESERRAGSEWERRVSAPGVQDGRAWPQPRGGARGREGGTQRSCEVTMST
jgi:hypothetical protein